MHADTLKALAAKADAFAASGALAEAAAAWRAALQLLPPTSQQHRLIRSRLAGVEGDAARAASPAGGRAEGVAGVSRWRGAAAGTMGVVVLLAGKLKLLALGLTKAKTLLSMLAYFGVYWSTYGWPLALGLVGSIYVHEMGHVAALRRRGIAAGAPLFIPGVGAVVLLKERIEDPHVDADVGLAGPVWGLGAALIAYAMYAATGVPVWRAIAQLGGVINLFNLIPVWQLDGARGLHALSTAERWAVVAVAAAAYAVTRQPLLLFVGGVAGWRATRGVAGPGSRRAAVTFSALVVTLAVLASLRVLR